MFQRHNRGNGLLIILIAVALLAALSYTITREGQGQQQNQLTDSRTKLLASDLISHANSAEIALKQMEAFGIDADQVLFDLPGTTDYNTNVTRQIYHPSGGGLNVFQTQDSHFNGIATRGWKWQNLTNVEWSVTGTHDLIFTFLDVNTEVCEQINKQLHNNSAVIATTIAGLNANFMHTHPFPTDFLRAECPSCDGKKSMCIANTSSTAFYNIIKSH